MGKRLHGDNPLFSDIPNGVPGLGSRLPIVFSEGVAKGRIDPCEFVRLTASNPARLFGLYPRKGTIAPEARTPTWWCPGDAARRVTITNAMSQHAIDYTPYQGLEVTGWPVAHHRGAVTVMRDGKVQAAPGSGRFLARGPHGHDPADAPRAGWVRRQRVSLFEADGVAVGRGRSSPAPPWSHR